MDTPTFPPDSPESKYLSRAIEKDIQVLTKQGPPAIAPPRKQSQSQAAAVAAAQKLAEELGLYTGGLS